MIDDALRRLETVLSRLEGAVAHRFEAERDPSDLETELALMGEDRARLVEVEATSRDVGQRLGRAIATVEGVLAPPRPDA
jgi:hypothetical protein